MKNNNDQDIIIVADTTGQRLDLFLTGRLKDLSRSKIQQLIRNGYITVNNLSARPSYSINPGDIIAVILPPPTPDTMTAQEMDLNILYEDKDIVVINKAAGLVVHPGAGIHSRTLVNGLLYHFQQLSSGYEPIRPGLVHRLDKDTSGTIVVAKNDTSQWKLSEQFARRKVKKTYRAFCWGEITTPHEIDAPIVRHPLKRTLFTTSPDGRNAFTLLSPVSSWSVASEIQLHPLTGRTHQIRVHLNHIGHPVLGDASYGGDAKYARSNPDKKKIILSILKHVSRHLLHAERLVFSHPSTGKTIDITAPLPDDFTAVRKKLNELKEETRFIPV